MSFILYIKHRFIFVAFCLSAFTLDQMYFVFVKLKETNQQNLDVLIVSNRSQTLYNVKWISISSKIDESVKQ